jgi:hypothetical protein
MRSVVLSSASRIVGFTNFPVSVKAVSQALSVCRHKSPPSYRADSGPRIGTYDTGRGTSTKAA